MEFPKFDELESVIRRALRQLEVWRERASNSEAERRRLQDVIERVGQIGDLEPASAADELERLRRENEILRAQLEKGRAQAEKLAREVEFLEDAR
jgi:chromosome segregation ATPase